MFPRTWCPEKARADRTFCLNCVRTCMNSLNSNQVLAVEFLRGESLTLQSIAQNASESMIGESMYVIRKALDALVEAILGFHEDGSVKGMHAYGCRALNTCSANSCQPAIVQSISRARICVCECVDMFLMLRASRG